MSSVNANEVDKDYEKEFENLVTKLNGTDIKQIKPGNNLIRNYYDKYLSVEKQENDNKPENDKKPENDNKNKEEKGKIDPYYRIKQLESKAGADDKAIKIIKSLELLVEDPYDNFNIKNFVHEYQKVHNIENGEGHTSGKINRNETYTTDYYAMPYDGSQDGNVQHTPKHENAYNKRGELIKNVKAFKNAGKALKKDVGKSKLKPEHKKEIYNIIDENNKLILEYDSTKTKDELSKLLGNIDKKLKKVADSKPNNSDNFEKSIQEIIKDLYGDKDNPFIDKNNENTLTTYDNKQLLVQKEYNEYAGENGAAMNPQDESDYMYSVTYKSKDEGQKYADIFGIETIFRILRLTGSKIIPDSANNNKDKKDYDVFNNYYKVDQKTKNPAYVSEYNKESTWNTKLLDPKKIDG